MYVPIVTGEYFASVGDAAKVMVNSEAGVYKPIAENTEKYDKLYKEYVKLCGYFAEGENDVLKKLKLI